VADSAFGGVATAWAAAAGEAENGPMTGLIKLSIIEKNRITGNILRFIISVLLDVSTLFCGRKRKHKAGMFRCQARFIGIER
jgi:hypothetical protein